MTEYDQEQSPLFRLPAELRDIVYAYTITSNSPIVDPPFHGPVSQQKRYPKEACALKSTCKRIQHEFSFAPFYTNNDFRFTRPMTLRVFTSKTPSAHLELVKYITFEIAVNRRDQWRYDTMYRVSEFKHYFNCSVPKLTARCAAFDQYHFREDLAKLKGLHGLILNAGIDSHHSPEEMAVDAMQSAETFAHWNEALRDGVKIIEEPSFEPPRWTLRDCNDGKAVAMPLRIP